MPSDAEDEMLDLFATESREHLQELERALLRLETDPGHEEALRAAARQTHNLKGAARILGFEEIEGLSHAAEDVLQAAAEGGNLPQGRIDVILETLDALRRLVEAASIGNVDAADVDVDAIVADLEAGPEETRTEEEAPGGEAETGAETDPLERARAHRIETIRVDPDRLDNLLRRASELSATVRRMGALAADVDESRDRVEDLSQTIRGELPPGTEAPVSQALRRDVDRLASRLDGLANQLERDTAQLETLAEAIEEGIQESRLLPMSTTFDLFARAVRDLARAQGKQIDLEIEGETVRADKRVIEQLKDPLMHLVRNAVDHGIEPPEEREEKGKDPRGRVRLAAHRTPEAVVVEVEDDGRGIDPDEIRRLARERDILPATELEDLRDSEVVDLVFDAGFTTREEVTGVSGRGIGLEAVAQGVDQLQGSVHLDSTSGEGTTVTIEVPVEISTVRVLLLSIGPHTYGLPIDPVAHVMNVDRDDVDTSGRRPRLELDGATLPVADAGPLLDLEAEDRVPFEGGTSRCVVLLDRGERLGLFVDDLLGETEIVVEPLGGVLRHVRSVAGASVLGDGTVCVVLDPVEIAAAVRDSEAPLPTAETSRPGSTRGRRVLLVEDTEVTRRQLRRGLEAAGYDVVVAEDGRGGLRQLEREPVDAVVTDILMPDLDGVDLTRRIRETPAWEEVPVLLVTTEDREETAEAAMAAGADGFISKDVFDRDDLLETLEELIT